ncbi:hypothetical protein PanWU01x14_234830 [Parasponia andersonii]|uniref:Uncharacterized protein n=1 Tax=Parasponia andersonii TaxID=3476 RepID=A0A2P5BJ15_PARAD|nr:hypothetical protein PanWU01x14_234830 [Parasponia andersonii]
MRLGGVNGGLFSVEGESLAGELDTWREAGTRLEEGEERRVVAEEVGGCGGEVEAGFEERGEGEREGLGGVGEDLVFEGDGLFEVLLSLNGEIEVWVSDPLDSGVDEVPGGIEAVGKLCPGSHGP